MKIDLNFADIFHRQCILVMLKNPAKLAFLFCTSHAGREFAQQNHANSLNGLYAKNGGFIGIFARFHPMAECSARK